MTKEARVYNGVKMVSSINSVVIAFWLLTVIANSQFFNKSILCWGVVLSTLRKSSNLCMSHCCDLCFTVGRPKSRGEVIFHGHTMHMRKSRDSNSFRYQCLSFSSQCILLPRIITESTSFSLIVKTPQNVVFSHLPNLFSSLSLPSTVGYCFCKRWSLYL